MKIKKIVNQCRRDFRAIYECEHCGHVQEGSGYDDSYFHNQVVPKMKCPECGKVASDDFVARIPKYESGMVV
jgi:predicted RNA-binding Zn-ribbon protein involved in translation (DUF1610 family)